MHDLTFALLISSVPKKRKRYEMRIASIPLNEELRLLDLHAYDVLDIESEKEFDDLLLVAAQIFGCSMAAITFVDRNRQFMKAARGFADDMKIIPRDITFCSHAILENDVLQVKDTRQDDRFCDNPMVVGGPLIRFYAGAPIVSKAGYKLGAVCVVDTRPRNLTAAETNLLAILSQQVSKLLELRLKNKWLKKKAEEQLLHKKELLHKLLLEQDNHSLQISTELHENIAQGLAATRFYLELAEGSNVEKDELIQKSRQYVELLTKQVKELSHAITPTTLKEFCLEELLRNLLRHFSAKTGIRATLHYEGNCQFPSGSAMTLYRIVEEQLKNVLLQGGANRIAVSLEVASCIHLCMEDDGKGVQPLLAQGNIGLQKILSRVESLCGLVDLSALPGGGSQLTITIPLQDKASCLN